MGSLVDAAKNDAKRSLIVKDCVILLNEEVRRKKGLTGIAVKGGFKAIKSFKPDILPRSLDDMLDEFAAKVDPFWLDCQAKGSNAEQYFVANKVSIANALLSITDERAKTSPNKVLIRAYNGLRGKAVQHIGDAMPGLARLIVKHAS
ncbi:MAG: hypothetical protein VX278_02430 [Myxococcota bacterium]|nr:hypothetical protein [Myxococcota bacterium]